MDRPLARESSKVESPPLPAKRPSARHRREQALQLIETGIEIEPTRLLCAQRLERIVLSRPRGLFGGGVCFDSRLEIRDPKLKIASRLLLNDRLKPLLGLLEFVGRAPQHQTVAGQLLTCAIKLRRELYDPLF